MIREVEYRVSVSVSVYISIEWWFSDELDMTVLRGVVHKMKSRGQRTDP